MQQPLHGSGCAAHDLGAVVDAQVDEVVECDGQSLARGSSAIARSMSIFCPADSSDPSRQSSKIGCGSGRRRQPRFASPATTASSQVRGDPRSGSNVSCRRQARVERALHEVVARVDAAKPRREPCHVVQVRPHPLVEFGGRTRWGR